MNKNILKLNGKSGKSKLMPNKPFNSKLRPYAGLIIELRRKRMTWQEIADELAKKKIKASRGNVCDFFKRYKARPNPMGWDDDTISSPIEESPNGGNPMTPDTTSANVRPKSPHAEQSQTTKQPTPVNVQTVRPKPRFGDPYAETNNK